MSDRPVAQRLQVKVGRRLAVVGAPAAVDQAIGVRAARCELREADVAVLFAPDRAHLEAALAAALRKLPVDAILWIAYPKLASKLARDLSRDIIHALAPDYGLDTVSQIAIDEDWSALRLKRVR
jgi:hypothetical protein